MRIQIIGASGSGKTSLGKYLSEELGLTLLESDNYLWADDDYLSMRPVEERKRMLAEDLATHSEFVFTGSVHSWDAEALQNVDILVLLTLDDQLRIDRLERREFARFGERFLEGGDHYEESRDFIEWAKTYLTADGSAVNSLATHQRLLSEAKCPVLILDASNSVRELASLVLAACPSS